MCNFRTLYHDAAKGYVIMCRQCRRLQLAFGNTVINFCTNEFASFLMLVRKLAGQKHPSDSEAQKNIFIPTPTENIFLLFSAIEINELLTMLEGADDELRTQALLDAFLNKETDEFISENKYFIPGTAACNVFTFPAAGCVISLSVSFFRKPFSRLRYYNKKPR